VFDLRQKLRAAAEKYLHDAYGVTSIITFDISLEPERADLTSTVALKVGKELKKNPQDIAASLADALEKIPGVASVSSAGPGFLNVTLTSSALFSGLVSVTEATAAKPVRTTEAPTIVEYSAPNIAKPLGIHHLLSTTIGQSIANLHRHRGYPTLSFNHLGDWGTQFGQLAVAHKKWSDKLVKDLTIDDLLSLYVRFHEEADKDEALAQVGRDTFRKLEEGDKELRAFWSDIVAMTMKDLERLYERLHVHFDYTHGESFYEGKMDVILEEGKKKKLFVEGRDGALVVNFPEETKLPTAVLQKGDGSTLYMTRDLAQVRYRIDEFHPRAMLYVVDRAQSTHFAQYFEVVRLLGWDLPILEHVVFGRMSFADRSMSTRKGNIVKLDDVLEEAVKRASNLIEEHGSDIKGKERDDLAEIMGVGSVVYGILSQNRAMDMVFDWKKVLTFEGNSAPYLQYTHARAMSVLRKAKEEGRIADDGAVPSDDAGLTPHERALLLTLLRFDEMLTAACDDRMPHKVANYLYELAQSFNAFYNADAILKAEEPIRSCRLHLTSVAAHVLKTGAELLTLRVPDRM
jgi:arginyl-tRNA synthetase